MAGGALDAVLAALLTLLLCTTIAVSQVLTPPYFNLAVGKRIEASSTCGEGVLERELYCKLTGANPARGARAENQPEYSVIQGQLCDYCDPNNPSQAHPTSQALDGTENWWQSPPLSRGLQYNEVNLTIDLGQEFHVAYVFIKMANSPRPGVFALERSTDYGQTWEAWQYFADTLSDCRTFFGDNYEERISRDDSVICTTEYSKVVPLEGGEIVVSLVNGRPSAYNFSYASTLQEWTRATNLRLRLLRTKTLLGHLMAIARQDPTVTRRYFYSVKDISIGGRCVCNGHASVCDKTDPNDLYKLLCRCVHNTCGAQCETCCPGFVQKPWRPATTSNINACERCQCHEHSTECYYDDEVARRGQSLDIHGRYEGGGVCQNCRHNTEGVNCERCKPGYYRPRGTPLNATNVCQRCQCDLSFSTGECEESTGRCKCRPEYTGLYCDQCSVGYFGYPSCVPCECNVNGTRGAVCEVGGGQCPCKANYEGRNCDRCAYGYYGFPDCRLCGCDAIGALGMTCDTVSGECSCKINFGDRDCSRCADGHYDYPTCQICNCDPSGSSEEICDKDNGLCLCKPGFGGPRCDRCAMGFYRYPHCVECGCQEPGTQVKDCDNYGQCICKPNFAGLTCDQCSPGHYSYPECKACNCDLYGSYGRTCDQTTGQCQCYPTFEGLTCSTCRPNYYNYPVCEECNCNPAGAKEVPGYPLGGCGSHLTGQLCECKERVEGHICDTCKPGYWNLRRNNSLGCEDCFCYIPGTTGGSKVCNTFGRCMCKPFTMGRRCDMCKDGFYSLEEASIFGCQGCDCDVGGAASQICDKSSGVCSCRPRVTGRKCQTPLDQHYFPTLYQHTYEMEDGRTESGGPVRYGFDHNIFKDYSWRGYAIFSRLQDEVFVDVNIEKPSLYRLIFRYISRSSVTADVTITPQTSTDVQQTSTVTFQPTSVPQFVTVGGSGTFVLNPGRWTISLKTSESVYVDYLTVLPQAYYEAPILQQSVNQPCKVPGTDEPCLHFVYVDVSSYDVVRGEGGYIRRNEAREYTQRFEDQDILKELGTSGMAHLDSLQSKVHIDMPITKEGQYILIVQYHSAQRNRNQRLQVDVTVSGGHEKGKLELPSCPYSSLCRQVVVDGDGDIKKFDLKGTHASIKLNGRKNIDVAIDAIIAIPVEEWQQEFIQPRIKCIRMDKQCIQSSFSPTSGSAAVEFESGANADRVETDIPPHIIDTSVKVIKVEGTSPVVNVKASILNPGPYVVVFKYFQPHYVGFDVNVNVTNEGKVYKGTFRAEYCPGVSGCRGVVTFEDVGDHMTIDLANLDLIVSVSSESDKPVWLDHLMIIPRVQYDSSTLDILPVDRVGVFITVCGQDNFHMDTETTGFCRDSTFSLTTNYNNGVKECDCDADGSTSLLCKDFGGQCSCRNHVIGRTCSQCKTGYYGFPNCRPCSCPSGLCDPRSGQCVCPPHVTGPSCNVCLPRTFGFHPLIGCEECRCESSGVLNNDLECNVDTGQCTCKVNVAGRRCNRCLAGFYNFPGCIACNCDSRGTTEDICDQRNAQCLCKENVQGPFCDQCRPSTFYLEQRNFRGCSKCFCFGTTNRCDSSRFKRTQVRDMRGWGITNLITPEKQEVLDTLIVDVEQNNLIDPSEALYWVAPEPYLKNKVTSYGGKLTYIVTFILPRDGQSSGLVKPDVRIEGNNMTLVHLSAEQPVAGTPLTVEVDLVERQFIHESTGSLVTREQFVTMLAGIQSLQIRASFYTIVERVTLSAVTMDMAAADGTGAEAQNVEQCECPPNYQGTSCEECAAGYYRQKTGPYLGVCVPCQCNGRANTCNPETGECHNCQDNFGGPQCLACRQGYYLDYNTNRCEICSCPLPIESNNFASTCVVDRRGGPSRCICLPGYIGLRCDTCDTGYHGNPNEINGHCQQCECNGNIDLRNPLSCDPSTGECLVCMYNTTGTKCERCDEWYYGDAITRKDCKPCTCNPLGSELCDHTTGICLCKPNIIGADCDRCAPGAFGFESGSGCQRCDCAIGSIGSQCDVRTGQCQCQPGVGGRRCDQCMPGHWDFSPRGCRSCECESDGATTCDTLTGYCHCLPGVTGPKCDRCLDRWVLIPEQGCQECDSCVNLLIDDVEVLDHNITTTMKDLDSVSVGVAAMRRLQRINNTVHELRPLVDSLTPDRNPLDPLLREMQEVKDLGTRLKDKSSRAQREAEVAENDASATLTDTEELAELVRMAVESARELFDTLTNNVQFAKDVLADIMSNIHGQNVEQVITQAEQVLEEIRKRKFDDSEKATETEFHNANDVLTRVKELEERALDQKGRMIILTDKTNDLESRLYDLINASRHSLDNSRAALDLYDRGDKSQTSIEDKYTSIQSLEEDTKMMLKMGQDLLQEARTFLDDAIEAYDAVERELSRLDAAMGPVGSLADFVDNLGKENLMLRPLVDNATNYANNLEKEAQFLDSMIADTRSSAEGALNASRAYQAIVDAISTAENATMMANKAAMEALDDSNGLADRARLSRGKSEELKTDADDTKVKVSDILQIRLDIAKSDVDNALDESNDNEDSLANLLLALDKLPQGGYSDRAREAAMKAMSAEQRAKTAEDKVKEIVTERLPEDRRKIEQIPVDISSANRDIQRAKTQVDNVVGLIPDATRLLDRLVVEADRVNLVGRALLANISDLRHNIDLAREEASRIRVGLSSYRNTTLQVRNPQNLALAGSYTKLSLYFKTSERNGFLVYIGPEGTTTQTDDFFSLEIVEGQAVLQFDLGGGTASIVNPRDVADGKWHEVIAERTGQSATLKIRTEDEADVIESGSPVGTYSVLNLIPELTRFYVGGVPTSASLEKRLTNLHFEGCIEDIKFDGVPVGVWDFIDGENNLNGCKQRDKLVGVSTNGFRFSGDGYVIMDQGRFHLGPTTSVKLSFKTYAEDGLMFIMGDESDFLAIELREGKVLMQYDLGSGTAKLESGQKYNDGKWHVVFASRINRNGIVKVDDKTVSYGLSSGTANRLDVDGNLYVGGYKGQHKYKEVTKKGFDGCIKDITLATTVRDINDNKVAKGVLPGCPEVARTVSLASTNNPYIAMEPVNVNSKFQATMKVKTLQQDGLIMYLSNDAHDNSFALSMVQGKIVLSLNPGGGKITHLKSNTDTYNDGRWHYITVTKNGKELQLDIDDTEMVKTKAEGRKRIQTTLPVYFGGVPAGLQDRVPEENVGTKTHFFGCVGDVTINGSFVNFALAPPERRGQGASLAGCPIPDPTPVTVPPTFPPPPIVVTQQPVGLVTNADNSQCVLPLEPRAPSQPAEVDNTCFRFGSHPESRIEFDKTPGNFRIRSAFKMEFKTNDPDGLLFYVADDRQVDYIAVYLENGQVKYSFSCGSGPARLVSPLTYNDGRWHTVKFSRDQRRGRLYVDGDEVAEGKSQGATRSINISPPFFVGALPAESTILAISNLESAVSQFKGSIRGLEQNDEVFGDPARSFHIDSCSELIEPGSFFAADGGHIKLEDSFKVGLDLVIQMEVRPRVLSGVLLSVMAQRGDYLILEMYNGNVRLVADNGGGEISTIYTPSEGGELCDGNWHSITAKKNKNVLTLVVDGSFTRPGIGEGGISSTDTSDPLYIGGVPDFVENSSRMMADSWFNSWFGSSETTTAVTGGSTDSVGAGPTVGRVSVNGAGPTVGRVGVNGAGPTVGRVGVNGAGPTVGRVSVNGAGPTVGRVGMNGARRSRKEFDQNHHRSRSNYVGCIKNLRFNNELQDLKKGVVTGHVNTDTCPTN